MVGRLCAALWLFCSCSFEGSSGQDSVPDGGEADARPPINQRLRKRITLTPPPLSGPVSGLPVAIILDSDDELASSARDDGADIVFADSDGVTALPHELEHFDPGTGALTAWVRVPQIAAGTTLFMYYGQQDASDQQDQSGTWMGSFASVWHLSDDPSNGTFVDSAGANDGSSSGVFAPTRGPGAAGFSQQFDGDDDNIEIGDPPDESLDFALESFSFSLWVNTTGNSGDTDLPWHKGGSSPANPGYCYVLGAGTWRNGVSDLGDPIKNDLGVEMNFLGRWVHIVTVVDRPANQVRAYADANLTSTLDISSLGSTSSGNIATISRSVSAFLGRIDEVRVYSTSLSEDWIRVEFANLDSPDTFITLGLEESLSE